MKTYLLGALSLGFSFLTVAQPTYAVSLPDIESITQTKILYSGGSQELQIKELAPGTYEIKSPSFDCNPPATGCDPDRYEINLSKKVDHIFGLGRQIGAYQVEVADFLDTSFGTGHIFTPNSKNADGTPIDLDFFEIDSSRMRTPVLVLPTEKLLIAYLQPAVKRLRLSRTDRSTQIVMKKVENYPLASDEKPGSLLVIKANSVPDLYRKYYQALTTLNFYFKTPHYKTFGLNWETYDEYNCFTNQNKIQSAINHFESKGLKLSTVTIGSGYWGDAIDPHGNISTENLIGCGTAESGFPGTESLSVSQTKYGGLSGITNFFNSLLAKGIYPMIGMRTRLQTGVKNLDGSWRFDTPGMVKQAFQNTYSDNSLFLNSGHEFYYETNARFKMLNLNNPAIFPIWVDLIKGAYGPFKGVKEDEMYFADQRRNNTRLDEVNLPDGLASKTFPIYNQKFNDDFVIIASGSWFSAGSDAQYTIARVGNKTGSFFVPYLTKGGDELRFYHETALSQVVSGYPNPAIGAGGFFGWPDVGPIGEKDRTLDPKYEQSFLRFTKLNTFYPVANYSLGFWHLPESLQSTAVFFMQLRQRLHQYVYDQARQTAKDGIPRAMQPLFVTYSEDPQSYAMYAYNDDPNKPYGEYLFGNALLVRPIFNNTNTVSVYFPVGKWKPFLTQGPTIEGGNYHPYTLTNPLDFPVFLKEGEVLIIGDANTSKDPLPLYAYVFLESPGLNQSSVYSLYKDGTVHTLQATKENNVYKLKNTITGKSIIMTKDQYGKGFQMAEITSLLNLSSLPGDLNRDGKVNIFDYNELVAKFGNPYTVTDYKNVLENFGK